MAYAEAVTATPPAVTDEMVADLRRELDDAELVELTMMVAVENVRSRFNSALGPDQPGLQGPLRDPGAHVMTDRPRRRSTGTGGCCSRVAYQMLGSVADAEDVVQDTWLRWSAADRGEVTDPRAYLVQITTRLALDRMGSAPSAAGELRRAVAAGAAADRGRAGRPRPRRRRSRRTPPSSASRCRWPCSSSSRRCPRRSGRCSCSARPSACRSRRSRRASAAPRPPSGRWRTAPGARARPAAAVRRRPAGAAGGDRAVLRRGRAAATWRRCSPPWRPTSS